MNIIGTHLPPGALWGGPFNDVLTSYGERYNILSHQSLSAALKLESHYDPNFVITGSTEGCRYDNLQYHKCWQSWHHGNSRFSESCLFLMTMNFA